MTFQQLTYVVEVSKCGSINKAANKLFLSQSGISTAIRELEEELGIQFFVRSNRGVEFTPDGREFLGYAASLLEQTPLRARYLFNLICSMPSSCLLCQFLHFFDTAYLRYPFPFPQSGLRHPIRHLIIIHI